MIIVFVKDRIQNMIVHLIGELSIPQHQIRVHIINIAPNRCYFTSKL